MTLQNHRTFRGRSLASGPNGLPESKPFRYHGEPDWNPAAQVPAKRDLRTSPDEMRERAAMRRARFAELRDAGKTVAEAAAEVDVAVDTGRKYETRRRKEAGL